MPRIDPRPIAFRVLLAGVFASVTGCSNQSLPRLRIPQLEGAKETVQDGLTRKYEDHAACKKTATDARSMVACMDAAGYTYPPRSADPQVMQCWQLRDTNVTEPMPEVTCFVRGGAQP